MRAFVICGLAAVSAAAAIPSGSAQTVREGERPLKDPFGIVQIGQRLLVTDRKANAVLVVDAAAHRLRVLTRLRRPTAITQFDNTHALVATGRTIVRVDVRNGRTKTVAHVSRGPIYGLVAGPDGIYAASAEGSSVVHIDARGKTHVVLANRSGIHGLLLQGHTLVVCESFAIRFFTFDLNKNLVGLTISTVQTPSGVAPAPSGWYVSEYSFGGVYLVHRDGTAKVLLHVPHVYSLAPSTGGTLVATTMNGQVVRIYPQTGAVASIIR